MTDKRIELLAEIMQRIDKQAYDLAWPYGAELDWCLKWEAMTDCPQVGNGGMHSDAYYDDGRCAFCGARGMQ